MAGLVPCIDYIASGINKAQDTKQGIISGANSCELVSSMIRKMEQIIKQEETGKTDDFIFDPTKADAEVETLVYRDKNENNKKQEQTLKEKVRVDGTNQINEGMQKIDELRAERLARRQQKEEEEKII